MADTRPSEQPLLGFMANDEWDALLAEVNELVQQLEALPDGVVKERVFRLLDGIDAIHREALRRLVRLFKDGVLEQVVTDPTIHTLMELYDLLPPAATPAAAPKFPIIPIRGVRAASPAPAPVRYPHWVPVADARSMPAAALLDDIVVDGLPLLLVRREDEWFALEAICPRDGASLRGAGLSGYTLSCPNHCGCHYDVRNGARIGGGAGITCHPVRTDDDGRVLVGFDMDFTPSLPSF
jgi:nitrite reductase/ring-hydroxylating ferredoxin subunit